MAKTGPKFRWVKLAEPSISLNSHNIAHKLHLKYSPTIEAGSDSRAMLQNVPDGVKNLVFNCHGFEVTAKYPAYLAIAGTITKDNAEYCARPLRNISSLRVIWLSACNIGGSDSARSLCRALASQAICYVATQTMAVYDPPKPPAHCVLDTGYAVPVYFGPDGAVITRAEFAEFGQKEKLFTMSPKFQF